MIVRSGRPSRAITTIGPVPWTAAIVPSSACVGECQLPPVVSCTLRAPSGPADHTLPWSMYTIESALATAGSTRAARPAARRIFGSFMRRQRAAPALPGPCRALSAAGAELGGDRHAGRRRWACRGGRPGRARGRRRLRMFSRWPAEVIHELISAGGRGQVARGPDQVLAQRPAVALARRSRRPGCARRTSRPRASRARSSRGRSCRRRGAAAAAASAPFSASVPRPFCARIWSCRQSSAARISSRLPASGTSAVFAHTAGVATFASTFLRFFLVLWVTLVLAAAERSRRRSPG